jgi:5'-methylthioadenosine phosphorylase
MLGAEAIVRLGTCGGLVGELRRGDFIVPTAAAHPNGSLKAYVADGVLPPVPDRGLTAKLIDGCRLAGVRFREGLVFSSDAFYTEDRAHLKSWMSMGVIGVEMECATLFTLAALRGFKASSLVIVSDNLVRTGEKRMLPAAELKARVGIAGRIVLDAITSRTD